ncbi:hypothetical protein QCA50_021180 [Cerrena zonata]|uniref:Uncharacterized protein n=1 Tax=Cerrena zonata TaxID=2478898 RepID=A0AAW0FEG3_9APHY
MGTLSTYKESRNIQAKTQLTTALVQNGFLQFLVLLAMNITTMVLDQLSVASDSLILQNASYFLYVQDVINSILLSHFIINLRSKSPLNGNISQPSQLTSTTVEFASTSILGDIGEPLNDSYGLGIADVDYQNVMGSTLPMGGDDSLLHDNTANDTTEVIALCEIDRA